MEPKWFHGHFGFLQGGMQAIGRVNTEIRNCTGKINISMEFCKKRCIINLRRQYLYLIR